ncbi:MAG: outer membrane beta-barrel protein [Bacteroidetes bacterium]|nr:outer membrane beta-barrel protein [Bacteroidota bacterium]
MKKSLSFILLLAIVAGNTYAQKGWNLQIIVQPGFSYGGEFDVPLDLSSSGWTAMDKSLTFNLNMGAELAYNFNDKMGISIGMYYSHQGQDFSDYNLTSNSYSGISTTKLEENISLSYIKIPFQYYYITNPLKKVSFIFSGGFYLGFLTTYTDEKIISISTSSIGIKATLTANGSNYNRISTDNYGTTSKSVSFINGNPYDVLDFGGILAAGIQLKLSDKIFLPIMLNYQIGFIDIKNQVSQYTFDNSGNTEYFWNFLHNDNNPNKTLPYYNSTLGLKIGFKIIL